MGEAYGRPRWLIGAAIFAAAFALCMTFAVLFPGIHYPDEVVQSLEQAHRAVFGYGLVPWEFRDGARSWLLPGLLMAPMWLGSALAPETEAYRLLAQAVVAAVSASTAVVGYWWGLRFGRWHAVLAALVLGTWFEMLYFGARALGEIVGSAFLFAGVFLSSGRRDVGRAALAGLCLGAAFVFRFHLAPAIALAAAWHCRLDLRRGWLPWLAGASLPLLLLGVTDALAWGTPFGSILANFQANIFEGRSLLYGTSPAPWYGLQLLERWGVAASAIAALAVWGARRDPLPLLVALVVVLTHSAIAHKEYRFIYPAIPLAMFLAALGSAELCRWLAARLKRPALHAGLVAGAGVAWLATSYALASAPHMRPEWSRGRAGLELMWRARSYAHCGVGLLAGWSWTGGYSSLHEDIPIHLLGWDPRTWRVRAFDAWILPGGYNQPAAFGYRLVQCEVQGAAGVDELCLWVRTGGCDQRGASTEAQQVLETTGQ
jgi:hypothetical protein